MDHRKRKFEREQKQEKMKPKAANSSAANEAAETDRGIVPGKKLPIWKKRETQINMEQNELDIKHETPATRAYGKVQNNQQHKENGRQLREIQENANFERIRQSTFNHQEREKSSDDHDEEEVTDLNKESFIAGVHDDEDDYYDNDAGNTCIAA